MTEPGRYLHGHDDSVLRSHRWRTAENSAGYLLGQLSPTARVLDVGCGPGTITADLAARLPRGHVVGVDASADVVEQASRAFPDVTFLEGDLADLPLPDGSFDVVHLHQVLQHLVDPVGAMAGLRRLIAPGGLLAARDADYGAMTWSPASAGLERWLELYRACAHAVGGEPDAGRHLERWAGEAGYGSVTGSQDSWVFTSVEDRAWWASMWADRVLGSGFADVALSSGLADRAELEQVAAAWRSFGAAEVGEFVVPHGEVLCRI